MNDKRIGYIRVSTVDQNTDRQLADLELDKTFEEKVSAKATRSTSMTPHVSHEASRTYIA